MSDSTANTPDARKPEPLDHFVSQAPFDAQAATLLTPEQEKYYLSSQWRLMWLKFRRHKLALWSGIYLILVYASILISEVIAPYSFTHRHTDFIYAPPQEVRLFHDGSFIGPYVYPYDVKLNMEELRWDYTEDTSNPQKLRFLCTSDDYAGSTYEFWGLFESNFHLVCPAAGGQFFFLGTDRLGRDIQSRIIQGARISLTVGLIGVTISFVLGITLGGMAGYFGGMVDWCVQRVIEVIRSFPSLPLWMALSAAMPVNWSPIVVFLGITVILGLLDWPGLARAVRSKLLALREEDFAVAAQLMGATPTRIIGKHLLPSFTSHLIASVTLAVPSMILGETALSFLGLGLKPPITSWGVLLNEAQNFNAVALYPWLLWPAAPVILVVLAFQFLGDGLRDAADPYK
ncbi:MAG: peptide ABC transporter permease [Rhodospirillaceae bacterium]|nr:peptide ABC transporter permease [Rhodospirillaceae bacterium]MAX63514.1 peptide ABC transporter permease [Rhodospirillaceae bacterium]MBB56413.1 peptide ABC transporter permease [Rhodospirillaceae bacterium]|tara:strand:- start:15368 stop:16573 length:1206 start_codon:yes stop_codon:yes gene_type:complete